MQEDRNDYKVVQQIRYRAQQGQALVEYTLLVVLLAIAFGVGLAATGPAIGNVFSNAIFNLVGNEPALTPADPGDFWMTVTAVASLTPQEQPLPTRTSAPPTFTPTDGPSPTPSPITPTRTLEPTRTPRPTATPEDYAFLAPHLDEVDEPLHWRVGAQPFVGTSDWRAKFYVGRDLYYNGASPSYSYWHREIDPTKRGILDWNWSSGVPVDPNNNWPSGSPGQDYSVEFTREIFIDAVPDPSQPTNTVAEMTIAFTAASDDGVRLWVIPQGQNVNSCSATGVRPGAPDSGVNFYGDSHPSLSDDCLVLDYWRNGGNNGGTVVRTLEAGRSYTIQVDHYQATGGQKISLDLGISANPDDTRVDNSGNVVAGEYQCNWGRRDSDNSNSLDFMWEEFLGGSFDGNARCHLEFRGFVYIPTGPEVAAGNPIYGEIPEPINEPEFIFWDVWDFDESAHTAWLEIAEYIPVTGTERSIDRDATWNASNPGYQRINLHQGNSQNFNWTRNRIDLSAYVGRRVTFRFVMQNLNTGNTRNWYVDDIELKNNIALDTDLPPDGTEFDLNGISPFTNPDGTQRASEDDFITSPLWRLTGTNASTGVCCNWELRPGGNYTKFSESVGGNDGNIWYNHRIHYVELDRWINVSGNAPDDEGDTGPALLSFETVIDVRRRTGIEVQYLTDTPGAIWQVVPGIDPSDPEGRIIWIGNNDNNLGQLGDQRFFVDMPLEYIPVQRFRLRFALQVRDDADLDRGMWIDNIRIHREDPPRYTDYPFIEDWEEGMDDWRVTSGDWARIQTSFNSGEHSVTDSPDGNYNSNTEPSIRILYPFDFNNDTPRPPGALPNNTGGAAVDPIMSFYFWRELDQYDDLYVDWRRVDETDDQWKVLWVYEYGMRTNPQGTDSDTAWQKAWEYVELDLEPMLRGTAGGDVTDDDILIRFRMYSDGGRTDDGVYVDDIYIGERNPFEKITEHLLWDGNDANFGNGTGDGSVFSADFDAGNWANYWQWSGDWAPVEYERRQGLRGFHESPNHPADPADPNTAVAWYNDSDNNSTNRNLDGTRHDSFQSIELATVIDLRATSAAEEPTLYWWNRYHVGNDDNYMVQISREMPISAAAIDTDMANRCGSGIPQCYEQQRGWTPWETVWVVSNQSRNYTWTREQVSLVPYASVDASDEGERIRIRFVIDAYDNSGNYDGWYIDNLSIEPRRDEVIRDISTSNFFDPARNLNNWVTEGIWGLSPQLFRGSGGGPAVLGAWQEGWWDCSSCENLVGGSGSTKMRRGADVFLDGITGTTGADASRIVQNIQYDTGRNAPRPGIFDATDRYVGRWISTDINAGGGVQAGEYTVIAISDDGVRVKLERWNGTQWVVDDCGGPAASCSDDDAEWNVIYSWVDRGRTGDIGVIALTAGQRYRVVVEYYEKYSDAVMILNVGGTSFSFTDSPRAFAGGPEVPAQPYGNSSLLLDGTLDLTNTQLPILQYYTQYETYDTDANVEVSTDGGFTWRQTGMSNSMAFPTGGTDNDFQNPRYGGVWGDLGEAWQRKRHNLTSFNGSEIMLRFRLNRGNSTDRNTNNDFLISWWVVDIAVRDAVN